MGWQNARVEAVALVDRQLLQLDLRLHGIVETGRVLLSLGFYDGLVLVHWLSEAAALLYFKASYKAQEALFEAVVYAFVFLDSQDACSTVLGFLGRAGFCKDSLGLLSEDALLLCNRLVVVVQQSDHQLSLWSRMLECLLIHHG